MSYLHNKLSDELIGQLAKLTQLAILTGTDIIDHMRMIDVKVENGTVVMTDEYKAIFDGQVEKLIARVDELTSDPDVN